MRLFVLSIACGLILLTAGCKKDSVTPSTSLVLETGTYIGKYTAGIPATTIYQFRLSLTKVNDTTYQVSQINSGAITDFIMNIRSITGTNTSTKIKMIIPRQASGATTLTGDQRVATGYDALWNAIDHSFSFGFVFDNNPSDYVRFYGLRE